VQINIESKMLSFMFQISGGVFLTQFAIIKRYFS
jgi:hypothetical protein